MSTPFPLKRFGWLLVPFLLSTCTPRRLPEQIPMRVQLPARREAVRNPTGPALSSMCYLVSIAGSGIEPTSGPVTEACLGKAYYSLPVTYADLTETGVTVSVAAGV